MSDVVYGWNAVSEALRGGESLDEVLVAQGAKHSGGHGATLQLARDARVPVRNVPRAALDRMSNGAVHQGVVATLADYRYHDLDEVLASRSNATSRRSCSRSTRSRTCTTWAA